MKKMLPLYASVQHVKNAQLMVQCEECNMWRLVYSKYKLSVAERNQLQQLLNGHLFLFSWGQTSIFTSWRWIQGCRNQGSCLWTGDTIEKLYYSAGFMYVFIVAVISHSLHLSKTHNSKHVHIILPVKK